MEQENKYECLYYEKDNEDSLYAKYNDLGKKQYNYHKDYQFEDDDSDYEKCKVSNVPGYDTSSTYVSNIISYCKNPPSKISINGKDCKFLYSSGDDNSDEVMYKYGYDKWVTNIIFGCFIIALNLGLAIFGFLLFKQTDGQSGPVTLQ